MTHERRRRPRREVDVQVRLSAAGRALDGHLHDVCRDAALVEADEALELEQVVELSVPLPGLGAPLDVRGRVIRVSPGDRRAHAMAVLFDDLPSGHAARIDFFVSLYDHEHAPADSGDASLSA